MKKKKEKKKSQCWNVGMMSLRKLRECGACEEACEWFREKYHGRTVTAKKVLIAAAKEERASWVSWYLSALDENNEIKLVGKQDLVKQTIAHVESAISGLSEPEEIADELSAIADEMFEQSKDGSSYSLRAQVQRMAETGQLKTLAAYLQERLV